MSPQTLIMSRHPAEAAPCCNTKAQSADRLTWSGTLVSYLGAHSMNRRPAFMLTLDTTGKRLTIRMEDSAVAQRERAMLGTKRL